MSSVRDILLISVLLFAIGISILFVVNISHRVNANLLVIPAINDSVEATNVINHSDSAVNYVDFIYLALFIGFFLSLIIFGYFVGGSPIMAPIYFFIVIIFSFVSVLFQLAWIDIVNSPELIVASANLPITVFILSHLGYFTVAMGLVGIIAMFAKPPEYSGGAF
jgi:hypothetical protein